MINVTAEIGATVWKIMVAIGQKVAQGDTLVILECMKMEMPVPAPASGTVVALKIAEGDAIEEGGLIAIIE